VRLSEGKKKNKQKREIGMYARLGGVGGKKIKSR
jgi:hypothetical protein